MAIPPVTGNNSDSANNTTINSLIREVNNQETTKIIKDDTGVRRVLIGSGANGFEGIKVSKSGTDVYTASNDQLIFNSEQNVFKIAVSGNTSTTVTNLAAGTTKTLTIAHNLGLQPAILCYVNLPNLGVGFYEASGLTLMPAQIMFRDASGFGNILVYTSTRVDTTNLYIDIINPTTGLVGAGETWSFKYYIMQETAA
jgi:hypothetical protein